MADNYFAVYMNLHRLASENLISAVQSEDEKGLDAAEDYAKQACVIAKTYFEIVLSHGILHTIDLERIAFRAQREGKI